MFKPITFKNIKDFVHDLDANRILMWELNYKPRLQFGVKTEYNSAGGEARLFDVMIVFTVIKSDHTFYKLIHGQEKLTGQQLIDIQNDTSILIKHFSPGAINFWFFRELIITVISGTYEYIEAQKVKVINTSCLIRSKDKSWKNMTKVDETIIDINYPIVTEINKYIPFASIFAASTNTIPGLELVEASIAKIE
jgi:hypothetical protein